MNSKAQVDAAAGKGGQSLTEWVDHHQTTAIYFMKADDMFIHLRDTNVGVCMYNTLCMCMLKLARVTE